MMDGSIKPESTKVGKINVYAQSTKPTPIEAMAPLEVARYQKSPPKKAGANCAAAAKDKMPIDTNAAVSPAIR